MRHKGPVLRTIAVILLAVLGCRTQPNLKPDKQPESYALPSPDDKALLNPINYPPEVLASDDSKKPPQVPGAKAHAPGAAPMGAGMGGMGGGGMSPSGY
jgi:hypothetical protein